MTPFALVVLLFAACSGDDSSPPITTPHATTTTVSTTIATTTASTAAVEAERDEASAAAESVTGPFDLDAFAAAWVSGDGDQIRAFYTDDAVMMPFGHILSTLEDHPMPEYWDVSGPDIDREAAEHDGAILEIFDVRRIGNMVVSTGQYTFPADLFPTLADTVIVTADIWHLRDGKIWRHFADFEVYVDGNLIEM
jgi:hypothetical protein